jgi:hypothetical protein
MPEDPLGPGLPIHPEARHYGPGDRPVLGGIGTLHGAERDQGDTGRSS